LSDVIIDSKYRILEDLPGVSGRNRHMVSDLISGRMAVLEHVPLENFDRIKQHWTTFWQPSLRERAARFADLSHVVKVEAVGAWESGPYYVYEDAQEETLQGRPPRLLPTRQQVQLLLADIIRAGERGDEFQNLRPEHLCIEEDSIRILPGAWVLPMELLARSAARSPYQPPELRYAGYSDITTSGYMLASVDHPRPGAVPGGPAHLSSSLAHDGPMDPRQPPRPGRRPGPRDRRGLLPLSPDVRHRPL
jgi:hypothetical protein